MELFSRGRVPLTRLKHGEAVTKIVGSVTATMPFQRARGCALVTWWILRDPAVPLSHALIEHGINRHTHLRGGVLPADRHIHRGTVVSIASAWLPTGSGGGQPKQGRHGADTPIK